MRLTLIELVALDGVYQGPGRPERGHKRRLPPRRWLVPFFDDASVST